MRSVEENIDFGHAGGAQTVDRFQIEAVLPEITAARNFGDSIIGAEFAAPCCIFQLAGRIAAAQRDFYAALRRDFCCNGN